MSIITRAARSLALVALVALVALWAALAAPVAAAEDRLERAQAANASQRFDEASRELEALLAERGYSADLLVDLGETRLREGQVALAILAFERARLLAPHDPGVVDGLERARAQADLARPDETALESVASLLPARHWLLAGLLALGVFCGAATLAGAWPRGRAVGSLLGLPSALVVAVSGGALWVGTVGADRAVVLEPEVGAHVAPVEVSEVLFVLRAGELVRVEDAHLELVRVSRASGERGWVSRERLEAVIPGALPAAPRRSR